MCSRKTSESLSVLDAKQTGRGILDVLGVQELEIFLDLSRLEASPHRITKDARVFLRPKLPRKLLTGAVHVLLSAKRTI